MLAVLDDPAVDLAGEPPLRARDDGAGGQAAVSNGEHAVGGVRIAHRVRQMVAVTERERRDGLVHRPVAADETLDRATPISGDRSAQAKRPADRWHVELPP